VGFVNRPADFGLGGRRDFAGGFPFSGAGHAGDRRIIHFDMDAFFAAVEQRDFPE